ncbi:MAG: sulfotransferase, partial [Acidimicrobiia bacterium]
TIFNFDQFEDDPEQEPWRRMVLGFLATRFTDQLEDEAAAKAAYARHNATVRSSVPPDRLLEWQPGDGWDPLCAALGVAVPQEPFPHVNTTADFRARAGMDDG